MKNLQSLKKQGGWIPFATLAITAAGTMMQKQGADKAAAGARDAGRQAKERGVEQKVYNEIAAQEVRAIGYANAREDRRQAKIIASRAVAVAAAGGQVQDVDHLIADIYGEGAYRASISLFNAESQARQLEHAGDQAAKYGADVNAASKNTANALKLQGTSAMLGTLAKGFQVFGGGGST